MRTLVVVCVLVLCLWVKGASAAGDLIGPWSVDERFPVLPSGAEYGAVGTTVRGVPAEMGGAYAYTWLRIYQDYLSVVMTSHCPMYPSCSNYSIQAVRRYGAFKGIILTADRLIHEWTEELEAPVVKIGGRMTCYDPVPERP